MRKTARERSVKWLQRRENKRNKRNPVAADLNQNGPSEKTHRDRKDKRQRKISIYDWDVVTDESTD